jgi:replicative DNA helicase
MEGNKQFGNKNKKAKDYMSLFGGRVPPQAVESEMFLLGAFLQDSNALVEHLSKLRDTDFYVPKHGVIFRAMQDLEKEGKPVDTITVHQKLLSQSKQDEVGGADYLMQLFEGVASAANVEYHIEQVKDRSILRSLIHSCGEIATEAFDNSGQSNQVLDLAERSIYNLAENNISNTVRPASEVLQDTLKLIEEYSKGGFHGTPTGFADLDNLTNGLHGGDLIVLAGRPGMGKTAFALSLVGNSSIDYNKKIVFFSLEMPSEQLMQRVLCARAGISMSRLRQNRLTREELSRLPLAAGPIQKCGMYIDDQPALSMPQLRSKVRSLHRQIGGVDLVVVDYLQLMEGEKSENRNQEVAKLSRGMKMLAKELRVPVITLAQLSRKTEDRPGQEKGIPQLSDLRDSGAIEQDADMVWFVHRPSYYQKKGEGEEGGNFQDEGGEEAKLFIAKHRNGPTGAISLTFKKESASFHTFSPYDTGGF